MKELRKIADKLSKTADLNGREVIIESELPNLRGDLLFVMSKCNKLVFFPTDTGNIGSGMNLEISCARGHNLPVYGYNKQTDNFSSNFNLETTDMASAHGISGVFYKKVTFV